MDWFAKFGVGMRALIYLRTFARNSTRIAEALELLARNDTARWTSEFAPKPKARPTVVTTLDVDAAEEKWSKIKRASEEGIDLEE